MTSVTLAAAAYRSAAASVAGVVAAVPGLERPFVRAGTAVWTRPGLGRFYRSVIDRYADRLRESNARFRRVDVGGISVVLDITEFTTANLFFAGRPYEPETTAYLLGRLRPGSVFVDVGANHGYFTVLAAARVGEHGRVVSFEPNPPVCAQLRAHVEMNGFSSRVEIHGHALADRDNAQAALFVSQWPRNSGVSSLAPDAVALEDGAVSTTASIAVRTTTFDGWFEASGFGHIDVVKVDVEGAEDRVAAGMMRALARGAIGAIVCETSSTSDAHRRFCAAGYTPRPLDSAGRLANFAYDRGGVEASW